MKNLKSVLAAMLFLSFAVSVNAQPQPRGGERGGDRGGKEQLTPAKFAEKQTDLLDQKLELTDAQEKTIYKIYLAQATKKQAEMEAMKAEREAMKAEKEKGVKPEGENRKEKMADRKDDMKDNLKEIMAVLKDDQKIEFAFLISEMKAKQGGKPQMGRGQQGGRPEMGR